VAQPRFYEWHNPAVSLFWLAAKATQFDSQRCIKPGEAKISLEDRCAIVKLALALD